MENIYLSIIIGYLILKLCPVIWRAMTLYRLFGYKRIIINKTPFIIKKLSPVDFLDEKSGLPMTFFKYQKGLTLWEQMQVDSDNKDLTEQDILDKIELAKIVCSQAVVHWPGGLKVEDFFNPKMNRDVAKIAWKLYGECLAYNLRYLTKCFSLDRNYVIHIAELCAKFGQRPHDHLKMSGGLTDIEAYMIDEFFYSTLLEKENLQTKKQNDSAQKRKK